MGSNATDTGRIFRPDMGAERKGQRPTNDGCRVRAPAFPPSSMVRTSFSRPAGEPGSGIALLARPEPADALFLTTGRGGDIRLLSYYNARRNYDMCGAGARACAARKPRFGRRVSSKGYNPDQRPYPSGAGARLLRDWSKKTERKQRGFIRRAILQNKGGGTHAGVRWVQFQPGRKGQSR